jgi:hypothetical protein
MQYVPNIIILIYGDKFNKIYLNLSIVVDAIISVILSGFFTEAISKK